MDLKAVATVAVAEPAAVPVPAQDRLAHPRRQGGCSLAARELVANVVIDNDLDLRRRTQLLHHPVG